MGNLHADPGARFVAETVLAQLQAFTAEIAGVRAAEDPECLHRMRVASRRVRTMLRLFADWLPAKPLAGWVRQVRRATRALGAARDLDVQILFVQDFAARQTDLHYRPGLARLLLRLQQARARRQQGVCKVLDELEHGRTLAELEEYLRQLRVLAMLQAPSGESLLLYQQAQAVVTAHLAEVLGYEIYLDAPPNAENQYDLLHAMRIAAKHLRYSMTVFAPLYGEPLPEAIKAARTTQELLGNLHDCDVWVAYLPRFFEEERGRMLDYTGHLRGMTRVKAGIDALLQDRLQQREHELTAFRSTWRALRERQVWERLLLLLQTRANEVAAPATPAVKEPA